MVRRTIILLMDSFGVGASADADRYGDVGSDTLGHIAETCAANLAIDWALPNLTRLGLQQAYHVSTGKWVPGLSEETTDVVGLYGAAKETSAGKDTPSGHWEIAGVPVTFDWGYFPKTQPCFPQELIDAFVREGNLSGVLGNKHASGTEIIAELGEEHIQTGKPIVYTSADSVFQIACHEEHFGLERLYELCHLARKLVDPYNIGRVIARPFVGEAGNFKRTGNRHDYSVLPPAPTLLDKLFSAGKSVIGIGKIPDIFAHQGISKYIPADGNMALFDATLKAMEDYSADSLIFTNFVDFDMVYGHRRNIIGYGEALIAFDKRLPELLSRLREGDLLVITADHGCDPSMPGSDHTREHVPVLCYRVGQLGGSIGLRESFADIGQSIAAHMGILPLDHGKAFL